MRLHGCALLSAAIVMFGSALAIILPDAAFADRLTSQNFEIVGPHMGALGAARLDGATRSSGASLGHSAALGPSGSQTTLATDVPGFWAIFRGDLPSLDIDGDGAQSFLDADDDGDGLLDIVETNTGVFTSPGDTGTAPYLADTDQDGYDDGFEVDEGSDPTDVNSIPVPEPGRSTALFAAVSALWALRFRSRSRIADARLERVRQAGGCAHPSDLPRHAS